MPVDYDGFRFPKKAAKPRVTATHGRLTAAQKARVAEMVDQRDKLRCQLTGRVCDARDSPDAFARIHHHHVEQRGRDRGPDATWNLLSVSSEVHDLLHANLLTVTGNADECVMWTIKRSALVTAFGRRRVPASTARGHGVLVVADADWPAYIKGPARHR
jgi:hypothetical protein